MINTHMKVLLKNGIKLVRNIIHSKFKLNILIYKFNKQLIHII